MFGDGSRNSLKDYMGNASVCRNIFIIEGKKKLQKLFILYNTL